MIEEKYYNADGSYYGTEKPEGYGAEVINGKWTLFNWDERVKEYKSDPKVRLWKLEYKTNQSLPVMAYDGDLNVTFSDVSSLHYDMFKGTNKELSIYMNKLKKQGFEFKSEYIIKEFD